MLNHCWYSLRLSTWHACAMAVRADLCRSTIVSNKDWAGIVYGGFCQSSKPSESTTSQKNHFHPILCFTTYRACASYIAIWRLRMPSVYRTEHHKFTTSQHHWQNTTTSSCEQGVYISMYTQEVTCAHLLPNMAIVYKTHPALLKAAKLSSSIPPHHNEYNSKHHSHKGNHKQRKPNVSHLLQREHKKRQQSQCIKASMCLSYMASWITSNRSIYRWHPYVYIKELNLSHNVL